MQDNACCLKRQACQPTTQSPAASEDRLFRHDGVVAFSQDLEQEEETCRVLVQSGKELGS